VTKKTPKLSIKLDSIDQFEILKKSQNIRRFSKIYIPAEELNMFVENVIPYIPPVLDSFFYDYEKILKNIKDLGYCEILAADHGGIYLCKKYGLSYSTDYTLNVRNSLSLQHYKEQGADTVCISTELESSKQQELSGLKGVNAEVMIYGRRLSMISVNCIDYNAGICNKKNNCRKTSTITNARGDSFIIKCRDCHIYYYEDRIFGNLMNIKNINSDILRIDAVCLNPTELNKVLEELNEVFADL
jgi:putative protease